LGLIAPVQRFTNAKHDCPYVHGLKLGQDTLS